MPVKLTTLELELTQRPGGSINQVDRSRVRQQLAMEDTARKRNSQEFSSQDMALGTGHPLQWVHLIMASHLLP